jgi:FAD/FMN-containing dehydrogenase
MSQPPYIITDPDITDSYRSDESGIFGTVAGVVRPRDLQDVVDLVADSARHGRKLLPVGCQTATTGAAVPQDDVVLDMRTLTGVVDIDEKKRIVEVLPGTITRELKDAVAAHGLFYPPDPTSEPECSIGGNVATNASGARSFRWGMTARWIEGLEVVTGTGEVHRFHRRSVDKNTAGYRPLLDPVELFIGCEGTLAVITRVWCRLTTDPGPAVSCIIFLETLDDALALTVAFRQRKLAAAPRCCDLLGKLALDLLANHDRPPSIPANASAALYVEFDAEEEIEDLLEHAIMPLAAYGVLVDDTVVAQTHAEREWLRELRHYIPAECNREANSYGATGGLKVSSEFCVPIARLQEMMQFVVKTAAEAGNPRMVLYGHIGNGHPHIFTFGRTREEVAERMALARVWYNKAVSLGGTVSGEHGIGKSRRPILDLMYPPQYISAMRALKSALDPSSILARGNIFPETESLVPNQL